LDEHLPDFGKNLLDLGRSPTQFWNRMLDLTKSEFTYCKIRARVLVGPRFGISSIYIYIILQSLASALATCTSGHFPPKIPEQGRAELITIAPGEGSRGCFSLSHIVSLVLPALPPFLRERKFGERETQHRKQRCQLATF
jgi:hypothetical protein